MTELARPFPRPTAQVEPYFNVLGAELTVEFLLTFDGAELYLAAEPKGRSRLETLVGPDKARALGRSTRITQRRVPLAKAWLAAVLEWQGHSTADIARTLRTSDISVRKWLKAEAARQSR
ncbi:helix-turn-helix domain-containing protein [Paracoccaceae bacterium Fryx2]|nr:helix-turn-helix domain-containing protein [Paracoccaceae bacterium Fryx2]